MAHDTITRAIAEQYSGKPCYLDGAPAKVCGRLNAFATVGTMDGARAIEYSWHTINLVMRNRGGYFETR